MKLEPRNGSRSNKINQLLGGGDDRVGMESVSLGLQFYQFCK